MSWTTAQVVYLIEAYRERPELYDWRLEQYKNRNLRMKKLEEVTNIMQSSRPGTTMESVKKKWNGLRQTFLAEKKKILKSRKTETDLDLVYAPTLFYFKMMEFLNDIYVTRDYESMFDETTSDEKLESNGSCVSRVEIKREEESSTDTSRASSVDPLSNESNDKKRKRSSREDSNVLLKTAASELQKSCRTSKPLPPVPDDPEERYGLTVADRLKNLSPLNRLLVKNKIDTILFEFALTEMENADSNKQQS